MIASMEKYKFLLLSTEQEEFINTLGNIGVVDITIGEYSPNQEEVKRIADISSLNSSIDLLTNYGLERDFSEVKPTTKGSKESMDSFFILWAKLQELDVVIAKIEKKISTANIWGAFRIGRINQLKNIGINIRYFSAPTKDYKESFEMDYPVVQISQDGSICYFVGIERDNEEFELPPIHYTELKRLDMDVNELTKKLSYRVKERSTIENELDSIHLVIPMLRDSLEDMKINLKQQLIERSNTRLAEDSLVIIAGWCPKDNTQELENVVNKIDGVVQFRERGAPEDNPPIKLKNSKLFSPVEIITKLFSLPNYGEVDMTPFFAPFFIFFVGICLGDAVYGLIFLVGATIARFKVKDDLKPAMTLIIWCASAAILMGVITGMYGGITVEQTMLLNSDQMFYFAIGVGVLQILYAMLLQAYFRMKRFGFLYGVSHIGWVMTLITLLSATVLPMVGNDSFSMDSPYFTPLIIVSLLLTIFFQNPKNNPIKNFGAGIWFLYNAVTGMLSDTLSYVRLFALGLSGGIIASVFNTLAYELSPDIPIVKYLVMAIILALGHGINIFMSAISAFVHPLRLTFVEFYKNVGFEGGGRMYDPFIKKTK